MERRTLLVVCAAQALSAAAFDASLVLVPALLADMGVRGDAELASWIGGTQAAAFLLSLAATPLWGRLGDQRGRARMLARAHAGLALSLLALACSRSPWHVLLARAVQGALAGTTPAALALASGGPDASGRMGWVRSAGLAGAFAGPLLGGLLAPWTGAAELIRAAALASFAIAALLCLEARGERRPEPRAGSARQAPDPAAFAQAAALSYFRSLEDPLLPVLVRSLVPQQWTAWTGLCLSAGRLTQLLLAPVWGRAADRRGAQALLGPCLAGAGAATAAQAFAPSAGVLVALRLALGACAAGIVAALYARAAGGSAESARGEAVAWTSSGLRFGNGLANASAGSAAALLGTPGAFVFAGACLLASAGIGPARTLIDRWTLSKEERCAARCSTGT